MKRVVEIDITSCPLRGGLPRVIEDVTDPDLICKIFDRSDPQPLHPASRPIAQTHTELVGTSWSSTECPNDYPLPCAQGVLHFNF